MNYICVDWLWYRFQKKYKSNTSLVRPVRIYTEINETREEVRKVEVFLGGAIGFASDTTNYCEVEGATTELSDQSFPELTIVDANTEFLIHEISKENFEKIWRRVQSTS